jgi:HKD family nuclease
MYEEGAGNKGHFSIETAMRFLRRMSNLGIDIEEFLLYLQYTNTKSGNVTAEKVASEFDISESGAAKIFDMLVSMGGVDYPSAMEDVITIQGQDFSDTFSFLENLENITTHRQRRLLAEIPLDEVEITTTTPGKSAAGSGNLLSRLGSLIDSADEELIIVTPFVTQFGIQKFTDRIVTRASEGVNVEIITRETDGSNSEIMSGIRGKIKEYNISARKNISVYDYGTSEERLHAKVVLSDKKCGYVGSANLTSYSLKEAVEIGVIVDGPSIQEISEFLDEIKSLEETDKVF